MSETELRVSPVRKSLTRPQLIFGCDRILFLLLLLICMALGLPGGLAAGSAFNVVLSIVIFYVGVQFLRFLTKFDPQAYSVFQRTVHYQDKYIAVSKVTRQDKKF
ncbi:MAG: VirB3 family type IV secretion system protein [Synergistaceae bacterium]|nr:VirB3 family type IV secretion system protein [Synergistaceae bacterium]